jgi:hypothetical protein
MRRIAALPVLLAVSFGALAQPSPVAEEQRQLAWVAERGRLLFEIDRAAWVGTDDMFAQIPNAASSGMRGYVVERDGGGLAVIFFGGPTDAPVAFYRGRIENRQVVSRQVYPADSRPPLTAAQRRLAAVSELSRTLDRRPCGSAPFNTAIIPPVTPDGPIDLYLLTPQVREGIWPAGGHYRFTFGSDDTILSSRAFTNSCIELGGAPGPDERPVALVVTHLLDPIPTEIHVFTSLTSGLALGVGTSNPERMWWVAGDRIEIEHGQP